VKIVLKSLALEMRQFDAVFLAEWILHMYSILKIAVLYIHKF